MFTRASNLARRRVVVAIPFPVNATSPTDCDDRLKVWSGSVLLSAQTVRTRRDHVVATEVVESKLFSGSHTAQRH